jgi:hypothetical protein
MKNTGQYLFFISVSMGPATAGEELQHQDKQPENLNVLSSIA